jgi:hypothetical protein
MVDSLKDRGSSATLLLLRTVLPLPLLLLLHIHQSEATPKGGLKV